MARGFAYADAHRARLGVNYKQIPVTARLAPRIAIQRMVRGRTEKVSDPVYAPTPNGGPSAAAQPAEAGLWFPTVNMVRQAYTLRLMMTTGPKRASLSAGGHGGRERRRNVCVEPSVGHLLVTVSVKKVLVRAFETAAMSTGKPAQDRRPECVKSWAVNPKRRYGVSANALAAVTPTPIYCTRSAGP